MHLPTAGRKVADLCADRAAESACSPDGCSRGSGLRLPRSRPVEGASSLHLPVDDRVQLGDGYAVSECLPDQCNKLGAILGNARGNRGMPSTSATFAGNGLCRLTYWSESSTAHQFLLPERESTAASARALAEHDTTAAGDVDPGRSRRAPQTSQTANKPPRKQTSMSPGVDQISPSRPRASSTLARAGCGSRFRCGSSGARSRRAATRRCGRGR